MAEEKSEISVSLYLTPLRCDPEEVTKVLGLEPTKTWRAGDRVYPDALLIKKADGWQFKMRHVSSLELNDAVMLLLDRVEAPLVGDALLEDIPQRTIHSTMFALNREIALTLSKATIARLAAIGADLDMDYYEHPVP